jgi:hypothetical protein
MIRRFPETIDNALDIDHLVNVLYQKMFTKYYSGNELNDWRQVTFFGGGNSDKYKAKIKELLDKGCRVKAGYRTSSMIRGSKTHYIFYKSPYLIDILADE